MRTLVKTIFGSTLFGTNTPESDMDYKAIGVPAARDLLLGTYKEVVSTTTGAKNKKNTKEDTDLEVFTLKHFLNQAMDGQTYALDMLFTPKDKVVESSPEWDFIVKNRNKLLHSNVTSFVGFAINQANKYKEKGERLKCLKELNRFLEGKNPNHKLNKHKEELLKFPFVKVIQMPANNYGGFLLDYLEVFGKKAVMTSNVKVALRTFIPMEKEYGNRAKMAEKHGVDFKSKYHALRVAYEALELLSNETITFPRPEATLLLSIRNQELTEAAVDKLIEDKLQEVREAEKTTKLNLKADRKFWEEFIVAVYSKEVINS